jgi:hypothetical protein
MGIDDIVMATKQKVKSRDISNSLLCEACDVSSIVEAEAVLFCFWTRT